MYFVVFDLIVPNSKSSALNIGMLTVTPLMPFVDVILGFLHFVISYFLLVSECIEELLKNKYPQTWTNNV